MDLDRSERKKKFEVRRKMIDVLILLLNCFLALLLGSCLLCILDAAAPNETGLMETQGLSVPNCYCSQMNRSVEMLPQ